MRHPILLSTVLMLMLAATVGTAAAQSGPTIEEQIQSARSAAPAEVAEHATVALADGTILHQGTSDWVCIPDMPDVPGNSPMCLDGHWRHVIDALMNKRDPTFVGTGFSYMLQGDMPVSNTDPYATGPTADNQWIPSGGPHLMIVFSDHAMLEGISTDPHNGGPFVMWKGTPYAHIMIPTAPRR